MFAAAASPATVNIDNFAFAPATLTITAGTTVTWKNEDDSPHRIGDKSGTFTSAALSMPYCIYFTRAFGTRFSSIVAMCIRPSHSRSLSIRE